MSTELDSEEIVEAITRLTDVVASLEANVTVNSPRQETPNVTVKPEIKITNPPQPAAQIVFNDKPIKGWKTVFNRDRNGFIQDAVTTPL